MVSYRPSHREDKIKIYTELEKCSKTLFFESSFTFIANLRGRYTDFPYIPSPANAVYPINYLPGHSRASVRTEERLLTHPNPPKPTVYLKAHSCIAHA